MKTTMTSKKKEKRTRLNQCESTTIFLLCIIFVTLAFQILISQKNVETERQLALRKLPGSFKKTSTIAK